MPYKFNPFTGKLDQVEDLSGYLPLAGGTMTGDIIVDTDSSYDLGSTTKFWQFIYTDGVQLNANASIVGTVRNDKMTFNIAGNGYYEWNQSGNQRMLLSNTLLQVVANIISGNDSTKTLGTTTNYWLGTYTDKLWLNATATLDGATAGVTTLTGALKVGGNVGFYGTTPVTQPSAYTPTNVVTDRSYDANATTTEELADVLGTLIADLQSSGLIG